MLVDPASDMQGEASSDEDDDDDDLDDDDPSEKGEGVAFAGMTRRRRMQADFEDKCRVMHATRDHSLADWPEQQRCALSNACILAPGRICERDGRQSTSSDWRLEHEEGTLAT